MSCQSNSCNSCGECREAQERFERFAAALSKLAAAADTLVRFPDGVLPQTEDIVAVNQEVFENLKFALKEYTEAAKPYGP